MKESQIENKVCKFAKDNGFLVYKFVSPNNRGVPDRIFIFDKNIFFIEFKRSGNKLSKLQSFTKDNIEAQGFNVYVIDNIDDGINLLKKYLH